MIRTGSLPQARSNAATSAGSGCSAEVRPSARLDEVAVEAADVGETFPRLEPVRQALDEALQAGARHLDVARAEVLVDFRQGAFHGHGAHGRSRGSRSVS